MTGFFNILSSIVLILSCMIGTLIFLGLLYRVVRALKDDLEEDKKYGTKHFFHK